MSEIQKQKQTTEKLAKSLKNWKNEQRSFLLGFLEGVTQFNKLEEAKNEKKGA